MPHGVRPLTKWLSHGVLKDADAWSTAPSLCFRHDHRGTTKRSAPDGAGDYPIVSTLGTHQRAVMPSCSNFIVSRRSSTAMARGAVGRLPDATSCGRL